MTAKFYEFVLTKRISVSIEDAENKTDAREQVLAMLEDGDLDYSFDKAEPDIEVTPFEPPPKKLKWFALDYGGRVTALGEFDDFGSAASAAEEQRFHPVWIVDEEAARQWLAELKELLT